MKFTLTRLGMAMAFMSIALVLRAQTGAKVSGSIIDEANGDPIIGATVLIKNTSTGFQTGVVSQIDGSYTLRQLPLGGPYEITVTFVGYRTIRTTDISLGLGDDLNLDFDLQEDIQSLEAIVVSGNTLQDRTDRLANAFTVTGKTINTIPTPTRDYEQLASLSAQSFVGDVGSRAFSGVGLGGGKGNSTGYTIDGANARRNVFGGSVDGPAFNISQEAIREFEIQTNEYSVLNGRNTGGSIKAVTKSGTNEVHGSAWVYTGGGSGMLAQDRSRTGEELNAVPDQNQIGFSIGLPIIKDKLLFFGVFDRYATTDVPDPRNQNFLDFNNAVFTNTADAEGFYGFTESEANSVLAAGNSKGYDGGEISTVTRDVVTQNIFARLDYNINEKHTASLRMNWLDFSRTNENFFGHGNGSTVADGSAFGTSSTGYTFLNTDLKLIGSLRSQISDNLLNNLRVQYITTARENAPDGAEQEARAYVGVGDNGRFIGFGQHTWVPEVAESSSFQIVDDVTLSSGDVIWTFGTNNQFYVQKDRFPHWTAPVVVFDDTDALINDQPSFYRQLVSSEFDLTQPVEYSIAELGLYAQAEFDLLDNLKAEIGLRWDAWIYGGDKPFANTDLLNSGLTFRGAALDNTNQINDANNIQPRLQLTWDVTSDRRNIVKFGSGVFTGPITTQPISFVYTGDGVARQEIILNNTDDILAATGGGDYTDQSNWLSSRLNNGEFSPGGGSVSSVTMIDPNFEMPQIWKTSLSYTRFIGPSVKVGLSGFYSITWNQMYHQDANLTTGSTNPVDGREVVTSANAGFGNVLLITNADYPAQYASVVLDLQANIGKGGLLSASYSKSAAYGNTSYTAGGDRSEFVASTYTRDRFQDRAGAPASGSGDKFVFVFASPEFSGFNIGLNFIAARQRRFTITTGGNPSAASNSLDVAYIPNQTSFSGVSQADYEVLLSTTSPEVRAVLDQHQGRIALVNAGRQPWIYQTSASVSKRFQLFEKYGITLRADVFNVLNLINYRAGYYNQVAVNNTRENTEQVLQLFNWNGTSYDVNSSGGRYRQEGQPYNIQFGVKVDF